MMLRWVTIGLTACVAVVVGIVGCGKPGDNGAAGDAKTVVNVFAAASMTDALESLEAAYEAAHPGVDVRLNLASSSTLAKQIIAGAPADIFVSANVKWMDEVATAGKLAAESRRNVAANRLVVIVPANVGISVALDAVADPRAQMPLPIAIGEPDHVPAGIYAKQALTRLGWWDALAADCVGAVDVRAAVNFVEQGRCQSGIVYATDAAASAGVRVAATFPANLHDAIVYPAARVTGPANPAADAFFAFMVGPEATAVFERFGFAVPPPAENSSENGNEN